MTETTKRKVALVTGATSGIGVVIAQQLADADSPSRSPVALSSAAARWLLALVIVHGSFEPT